MAASTGVVPTAVDDDVAPGPVAETGDAERRITRQFAVFVGAGYLAYLLINVGNIVGSFAFMDSWWALGAPVAVYGSGLAIGLAGALGAQRWIRRTTLAAAVLYLAAVLTTPIAWTGELTSNDLGLWYASFLGLVAVAVGMQPGIRPLVYLGVVTVAVVLCNTPLKTPENAVARLPDIAFAFAFSMPFVCATLIGVRTARVLDRTREETYRIAADTAAAQARSTERARFDALTHDGVMAALLGAARMGTTDDVRALAQRTLADLAQIASPTTTVIDVGSTSAARVIRAAVADVDDSTRPTVILPDTPDAVAYPTTVVETVAAATAEAVRNSARHSQATVTDVVATLDSDAITVTVADDGRGFDPQAVQPHRLGITVSIVGRMRQVDGGDAAVVSRPGRGTRVEITWKR
ncbi:sensor histidine kinase [Williamsia deligens]|uniref:Sensor histidine kinase n=1 Tax=Williamsia deligens TaxID=321325 RepID=A0ABW3G3Z3_9NOCA|nr:ATP-binding protein [Williamsia deligens]MCP2194477.1 Signal transduction histidine kinase [Williamsia deligens]